MAVFKVGERARFVGPLLNRRLTGILSVGDEVLIAEDLQEAPGNDGPEMVYVIDRTFLGQKVGCPPNALEKLIPDRQLADRIPAEPQFINHQLPRWLNQEEKIREPAKS